MTAIGVIGCGRMGRPMAEAMLAAGFPVRGRDIRDAKEFDSFATHLSHSADAFADGLTTAISVVRDEAETEAALFGADGVLQHANNLETLIISSTLSPRYVRDLTDRVPKSIALIDAPMSGAAIAAQEARLTFMIGGKTSEIQKVMPLFQAMGTTHHHIGAFGFGMTAKVLNNLVAASSTVATRLALDWCEKLGLKAETLLSVMNDSSGQTWFGSNFDVIEFARDGYAEDNSIGILAKDVAAAISGAPDEADTALPEALIAAVRGLTPRE